MATPEVKLKQILCTLNDRTELTTDEKDMEKFKSWFLKQFELSYQDAASCCSIEDFSVYFLRELRQQMEIHLRSTDCDTPKSQTPVAKIHNKSRSNTFAKRLVLNTTQNADENLDSSHGTGGGTFNASRHHASSSRESSFAEAMSGCSSTPVKNSFGHPKETSLPGHGYGHGRGHPSQQQQQQRRSGKSFNASNTSTPNSSGKQRFNNSSPSSNSFCLGDFLVSSPALNNRMTKKKANLQQQQPNAETPNDKPKKRVQIRTVKRSPVTTVNKLFDIASTPEIVASNNNELSTKKSPSQPKTPNLPAAAKVKTPTSSSDTITITTSSTVTTTVVNFCAKVDLSAVTQTQLLQQLACIHALLIEINLCVSVLNEMSFLLSFLNLNTNQIKDTTDHLSGKMSALDSEGRTTTVAAVAAVAENPADISTVFQNLTNCVFFAISVLNQQRHLLAMLDLKSLDAVLQIESLEILSNDLKQYLDDIFQWKQQLETQKTIQDTTSIVRCQQSSSFKMVYYQEEEDSRRCFPTNNEFGAFKTQRDLFYETLKLWETKHMKTTFNFTYEIAPKISDIFRQSENPINMTHFAKLFVSQLLISATDATSPEEIGLKLDVEKLTKLTQRMIVPSKFSIDYQFPRGQAFFRDFIINARSVVFAEQLKIALYLQLITLNNATIEQQGLYANDCALDGVAGNSTPSYEEYVVRPDVLASMLILAKFLGFVQAQPFQIQQQQQQIVNSESGSSAGLPSNVELEQIQLRSIFQPNFDVCKLLQTAIHEKKLLITLPWLVQYLAMLDNVSLQLTHIAEALKVMFSLYSKLGVAAESMKLQPTSMFIVRCCIGWLCEKRTFIAEQYYAYRAKECLSRPSNANQYTHELHILVNESIIVELPTDQLMMTSIQRCGDGKFQCQLQAQNIPRTQLEQLRKPISIPIPSTAKGIPSTTIAYVPHNARLESIINVACPFLAEFRVAIKPTVVTRTGNYRHIATRVYELPTSTTDQSKIENTQQSKLVEVFLQSQAPSLRTMLEYIIERTYKATIKDAQFKILLPSKKTADAEVNRITSTKMNFVAGTVEKIYDTAKEAAIKEWDAQMPPVLDNRIKLALDALLPVETLPILKQTYYQLIKRSASQKIQQWRYDNMIQNNFYCNSSYYDIARKICKVNSRERITPLCNELRLQPDIGHTSDLVDRLQYYLHCSTLRPDISITDTEIIDLFRQLQVSFKHTLPTLFIRLVGQYMVELLQHIISKQPQLLTDELINEACQLWLHAKLQAAVGNKTAAAYGEPELTDSEESHIAAIIADVSNLPNLFDALITKKLIEMLAARQECYQRLQKLLVAMIIQRIITPDFVNVAFMPIFKEDWSSDTLNMISNMLSAIAKETAGISSEYQYDAANRNDDDDDNPDYKDSARALAHEKSHLLMEVLADFSRDIDQF